ncbi:unnamed protein product [Lactuca saligna]|uniref:Uncharacterized protein n=1 Tax=Lactuca saligna TaxID=75948 RepID=A0AA35VHE3_LACSI|nr:unnamed protein product [Lactuca saligna]
MAQKRIAVVTGGNKGLGLEICKQLAKDVMVVLTARDEKRGTDAVVELHSYGLSDVVFYQLDVTFPASIASLANFVDTRFGKLNILVNNVGVITNNIDEEFFSNFNLLTEYVQDEGAKKILSDVDGLTEEVVDGLMSEYLKDAKDQESMEKKGWSNIVSSYVISKAALNAYTGILAKKYPFLSANAITLGYLATDFTSSKGIFTVEEGARGPVRLALILGGGPSGQYFFQMEKSTF